MSFFIWSQFAIVCIIGAISPGPSLAVVIRNNINHDRFSGILTSIGHGLGICVYATLAVLGLGIILEANQYMSHTLTDRQLCDIELILNGGFSTLT